MAPKPKPPTYMELLKLVKVNYEAWLETDRLTQEAHESVIDHNKKVLERVP